MTYLRQVISGGQTGADQGGLIAAWERGIATGGWAPREYRTNIGPCPLLEVLGLQQTEGPDYEDRTRRNVEAADVTLLFGFDLQSPGSRLTRECAQAASKPIFLFEFSYRPDGKEARLLTAALDFLELHRPAVVNVAGNRDTSAVSTNFKETRRVFGLLLDELLQTRP